MRYSVKAPIRLVERIIPFFEERPTDDSQEGRFRSAFSTVISIDGERSSPDPRRVSRRSHSITETMNRKQRSRYLESSEAIRQPSPSTLEMKIWSEPRGDMGIT